MVDFDSLLSQVLVSQALIVYRVQSDWFAKHKSPELKNQIENLREIVTLVEFCNRSGISSISNDLIRQTIISSQLEDELESNL